MTGKRLIRIVPRTTARSPSNWDVQESWLETGDGRVPRRQVVARVREATESRRQSEHVARPKKPKKMALTAIFLVKRPAYGLTGVQLRRIVAEITNFAATRRRFVSALSS
jgi:hypothetical protein